MVCYLLRTATALPLFVYCQARRVSVIVQGISGERSKVLLRQTAVAFNCNFFSAELIN